MIILYKNFKDEWKANEQIFILQRDAYNKDKARLLIIWRGLRMQKRTSEK